MTTASVALDALLGSIGNNVGNESSNGEREDQHFMEEQTILCEGLIQTLTRVNFERKRVATSLVEDEKTGTNTNSFIHTSINYNNKKVSDVNNHKSQRFTLREVFVDSKTAISLLPPLLASLMRNRVEMEELLPASQDGQETEDGMRTKNAITLTRPALIAAKLYSTLLGIPGAVGSGLIEMEAIGSLAALFRRWRTECIAAIDLVTDTTSTTSGSSPKKIAEKRKASRSSEMNPIKRGQRSVVFADADRTDSESEGSDGESQGNEDGEEGALDGSRGQSAIQSLSETELLFLGLKAAYSLSEVPMQKEIMSWSSEAREALMDAITSVYGTVCSLVTAGSASKLDRRIVLLQRSVVNRLNDCLTNCIRYASAKVDGGPFGPQSSSRCHETCVFLFRGLYPVMTMREHLPNGEAGKQIACQAVSKALEAFVKCIAEEIAKDTNLPSPGYSTGPKVGQILSSADHTTTPKASKTGRKKRVSFGLETTGKTPMLKSARKGPKTSPSSTNASPHTGTQPRPALSAVLGLMQKLATTKGLDRVHLRNSVVACLQRQLEYLPPLERTYFLRFLHQLCRSKVPAHRLVSTEILGRILVERWLWEQSNPQFFISASQHPNHLPPRTPTSAKQQTGTSPAIQSPDGKWTSAPQLREEGTPCTLLVVLIGRLLDRVPAVRAQAAGSLADLLRQVSVSVQHESREGENTSVDSFSGLRTFLSIQEHALGFSLRKRAVSDAKASVRRASVEALTELMLLGTYDQSLHVGIKEEDVATLGQLCLDCSLLTRKAAAQSLTHLLIRCMELADDGSCSTLDVVSRCWCFSVLPMVHEPESGCCQKAVELGEQMYRLLLGLC